MIKKDVAVSLQNVSKVYKLYHKPIDRLKESVHPFKKRYHKEFYALKDISLEIRKGEVLGIVGVNGAGKSTLLKIIAGVMSPTCGSVQVDGKVNAILELGSGLKPEMTGRENISLNLQINGIGENIKQITDDIIEFADIGEYIEQPIKTYSSGMRARLGFAITTSTDPDVLIVDEVLAVGDVLFQRKCFGKIEKLFKDGKTVIFVSHSAQSVVQFCSRAVLLYDRSIILDDTPKRVTDFYQQLVFSKDRSEVIRQAANNERTETISGTDGVDNNYFIPGLTSTPNVIKNFDVDVSDITIRDKNRNKVNILNVGQEYSLSYKVEFNVDCTLVKFGHLVTTHNGLIISGETLPERQNPIPFIAKGAQYEIRSTFICSLIPGAYFIDVGATSDVNNEKVYLSMHYDALIFKVQGQKLNYWGQLNIWKEQKVINES